MLFVVHSRPHRLRPPAATKSNPAVAPALRVILAERLLCMWWKTAAATNSCPAVEYRHCSSNSLWISASQLKPSPHRARRSQLCAWSVEQKGKATEQHSPSTGRCKRCSQCPSTFLAGSFLLQPYGGHLYPATRITNHLPSASPMVHRATAQKGELFEVSSAKAVVTSGSEIAARQWCAQRRGSAKPTVTTQARRARPGNCADRAS